jgi:hypothetical protein
MLSEAKIKPLTTLKLFSRGNYTLKSEQGPYLKQNDNEVRNPTYQGKGMESKSFSDASKMPLQNQQYNIPSIENPAQNGSNFITSEDNFVDDVWQSPGNISEQEKIEIIKTGFQLQAEDKISLKKYYESKEEYNGFQSKGYSIQYESIRRNKLYKNLND